MTLRIATWNMDHWRRTPALRERGWSYLEQVVAPDIALLQEACPAGRGRSSVYRERGILDERRQPPRDLGWGSAVVSYGPEIQPIESVISPFSSDASPLLRTFPGTIAVAEVVGDRPLVVVSAYGLIDRGYADTTVHRILSDLTPLVDARRGRGLIVAGDLNITTQWSEKHRSFLRGRIRECLQRDLNLFARFEALGLRNVVVRAAAGPLDDCGCEAGDGCRHVQTQRHNRSTFPWQNDYVFVSEDLVEQVSTVTVFDRDEAWELSGHCPIAIDLADR